MAPMHVFESRKAAIDAVSIHIEYALHQRLEVADEAAIVLSGGATPGPIYSNLSHCNLDWHRVRVLATDERWVPPDSEDSNEHLIRQRLMTSRASCAKMIPYYDARSSPDARARAVDEHFGALPLPFACTLLGMGEDGHIASLFPDAGNLAEGLNPGGDRYCIAVETAASPHVRLSLTLRALLRSREILLVIFGDEKRKVLEQAKVGIGELPIATLLEHACMPVHVYWAE